jgi:large subunit ribosomal protein L33
MAKKNNRQLFRMVNKETGSVYYTRKNVNNTPDKLELKKYDPKIRKVALFKEVKADLGRNVVK